MIHQYIWTTSLTSELLNSDGIAAASSGKSLAALQSIFEVINDNLSFNKNDYEIQSNNYVNRIPTVKLKIAGKATQPLPLVDSYGQNYNLNVTEVRDSDFKNAFPGILNFTVGILDVNLNEFVQIEA